MTHRLLSAALVNLPEPRNIKRLMKAAADESGIEYSAQQADAIRQAASVGVLLITGGPGTGKTTILKGILSLLGQMQCKCLLAAPTGRAAKRLSEVTGEGLPPSTDCWRPASTPRPGKWSLSGMKAIL